MLAQPQADLAPEGQAGKHRRALSSSISQPGLYGLKLLLEDAGA